MPNRAFEFCSWSCASRERCAQRRLRRIDSAAAVRSAGLDKTLNARHAYTLMIPANSAFASLSKTQIIHLKNSGDLLNIVRYHALKARVSPQQFASGARPATLQGKPLTLSKSGSAYKVNGATVLCGNIKTANATVYIVSKVLLPPG